MHRLPPQGSEARECFDISDLVAIGTGERQAPTLIEARASAKRFLAASKASGAKRVFSIVLRGNDDLELVSIGPRGGWKPIWKF